MNPVLRSIYSTGVAETDLGPRRDVLVSGVTPAAGELLRRLASSTPRTLEIGLAYGLSALWICDAHAERGHGRHTAIDPMQTTRYGRAGLRYLEVAGFSHFVRFLESRSDDALPRLVADGERIDFAFIDGLHLFDAALLDFHYVDRMLEVGGIAVFDDLWMPSVRRVVSFVARNCPYERLRVHSKEPRWKRVARVGKRLVTDPGEARTALRLGGSRMAVLRKVGEDSRPSDHYRSF